MARKIIRRSLRFLGITALILVLIAGIGYLVLNKSMPEGQEGPEAEAMADKIMEAVNADAWDDLNLIAWTFRGAHSFVWDQKRNLVEVKWDDNRVLVAPESGKGLAWVDGEKQEGEDAVELVAKGKHLFWNDSFWMHGYTKLRDPGTTRKIVELEDGDKGLLVTYSSGGTTPGDSYLWMVDENGLPTGWQMWVEILPIGGLEFSFEQWAPLHNGAMLAYNHSSFAFDIPLDDVQSGDNLKDIGRPADLFDELIALGK